MVRLHAGCNRNAISDWGDSGLHSPIAALLCIINTSYHFRPRLMEWTQRSHSSHITIWQHTYGKRTVGSLQNIEIEMHAGKYWYFYLAKFRCWLTPLSWNPLVASSILAWPNNKIKHLAQSRLSAFSFPILMSRCRRWVEEFSEVIATYPWCWCLCLPAYFGPNLMHHRRIDLRVTTTPFSVNRYLCYDGLS